MENSLPYLFAGYTVIWIALFVYILHLHQREKELRQELEALQDKVEKDGSFPERPDLCSKGTSLG